MMATASPPKYSSVEESSQNLEDYCLSKAMAEARETPLLNQREAIHFLETEDDDLIKC